MTEWEYRLATLELNDLAKDVQKLDELKDDGWELVALLPRNPKLADLLAVYKRPKTTKS